MTQPAATARVVAASGYDIILRERAGSFLAFIREINLVGRGATPGAAVADLAAKHHELMSGLKDIGEFDSLPGPRPASAPRHIAQGGGVGQFVVKCCIVFILIGFVIGATALSIHSVLRSVGPINTNVLVEIDRLARRVDEIPENRLKQTQDSLRTIAKRLGPLAAELRPLIHPDSPASAVPQR